MLKRTLFISIILLGILFAEDYKFPEIDGWQKDDTVAVYDASNLWERIDGAADLFLNYGFQELRAADMHKGKLGLALEIYDMGSPLNAFGIYNTEAPANKKREKIGAGAVISAPTQGFMLKDRYYIKIDVFEGKMSEEDGIALFKAADAALPGNNEMPAQLSLLPKKMMINGSLSYVKNGFQGLSELQNCLAAKYKDKSAKEFGCFVILEKNNNAFLKKFSDKWKTIEQKGSKIIYREIPYKGFIGILVSADKNIGVTDCETKEIMLERLNALK